MARKFLFVVAFFIVLIVIAGIVWAAFGKDLTRIAFVPTATFVEQKPMPGNIYANRSMWYARPDIAGGNPAEWLPADVAKAASDRPASVFFVHPTSYLDRSAWNAPLDDASSRDLAATFIRGQASSFNNVGTIWAPRYRQATFGSFLTTQAEAQRALDAAYVDVARAFDSFIEQAPADKPIILAGHSQGALHLTRLLREKVAGRPLARRIVAAYVVGWPISVTTDLAAMGLPACARTDQTGCILSWQSFAEPADTSLVTEAYDATTGFNGQPRRDTPMLCTNPLTGTPNSAADAKANLGALIPDADLRDAKLEVGTIPARCGPRGFLLIGEAPKKLVSYVLPGKNYHVFDYTLFWSNVRADAARRVAAFAKP